MQYARLALLKHECRDRSIYAIKKIMKSVLIFMITLVGCAPIYIPAPHNTPMFSAKKEFQATAWFGSGYSIQAAYSFSDHIGVSANYFFDYADDKTSGKSHQAGEVALGYYTNYEDLNELFCFELFGGYGMGSGTAYDSTFYRSAWSRFNYPYEAEGRYDKIFVQPSLGMFRDRLTWNFSTRFTYLKFSSADIKLDRANVLTDNVGNVFLAMVGNGRIRLWESKFFATFQGGYTFHLTEKPFFDYQPYIFFMGLEIRLKPKSDWE